MTLQVEVFKASASLRANRNWQLLWRVFFHSEHQRCSVLVVLFTAYEMRNIFGNRADECPSVFLCSLLQFIMSANTFEIANDCDDELTKRILHLPRIVDVTSYQLSNSALFSELVKAVRLMVVVRDHNGFVKLCNHVGWSWLQLPDAIAQYSWKLQRFEEPQVTSEVMSWSSFDAFCGLPWR